MLAKCMKNQGLTWMMRYRASGTLLKQLREITGSPLNDCKTALQQSNDDLQLAQQYLKERGLSQATKKLQKEAREGVVALLTNQERDFAVLAEVNCETDFVARTDEFLTFTQRLVSHALQGGNELSLDSAATINEYLTRPVSNFGAATIDETQRLLISKLQENVVVSKLITMKAGPKCVFGTYLHNTHGSYPCASSGCLIELQYNLPSLDEARRNIISEGASNLAISYLGMKPQWIDRSTVPQATIEEQHALLRKSLPNNKPEKILVDIIAGKMEKYYADHVFLDMEYVLAEDLTIKDYLRQLETDIGGTLQLKRVVTLSIK